MISIDDILNIDSAEKFGEYALGLFRFQSDNCDVYGEYVDLLGIDRNKVDSLFKIPFLPVSFFKTHKVYCGMEEPEKIFTSSTTTGTEPARHYVKKLTGYEKTFRKAFYNFFGNPADYSIYALLPGYLEREGSSLVYMVNDLIGSARGGGFFLYDHKRLNDVLLEDNGPKILFGVSYALLDFAAEYPSTVDNLTIIETGGMKGRRQEISKKELHKILKTSFPYADIASEYGMAELMSQAYSIENGVFSTPPWMKILVRDINNPFDISDIPRTGGINIIDLANLSSCAFIQTDDTGSLLPSGEFTIRGRIDKSDIRGCNLLVDI